MSRTDVSRPASGASSRLSPRLAGQLALAGAGIFAALVILLHILEDEFQPSTRFISEYVLGDWGWLALDRALEAHPRRLPVTRA